MSIHTKIQTRFRNAGEFEGAMAAAGIPCMKMHDLSMKDGSSCHAAYSIVVGSERLCAWQLQPNTAFQFQSTGWWFSNRTAIDAIANLDEARVRQLAAEKHLREENQRRETARQVEEARDKELRATRDAANALRAEEALREKSRIDATAEADAILAAAQAPPAKSRESYVTDVGPSKAAELVLGRLLQDQARRRLKGAEDDLAAQGLVLVSEEEDDEHVIVLTWKG